MKSWLVAALLATATVLVVQWADRPPAPRPATVPLTRFSEPRARPVMRHLAGTIGRRTIGTPGRDSAAAFLVATLRENPGVQVRVQEWAGMIPSRTRAGVATLYHARNVLARIPGDSASAVLVSAHYDSPPESVGAGDNGVGVAAAVETLRALAAGPRPRHTIVFNFNDGEESGLLGSAAFLRDPWARPVRAFVNLESAGPGGKAILFQAGPENAWLAEAYARAVPHPYGTVLGQDLFASGVIPSDTDFRIYRDQGGLRGFDMALFQDGWAYHTGLDQPARVQAGAIQHMGENTLALVRALADGPLPGDVGGEPGVYYDVLGRWMFAYGAGTGRFLALAALGLAAGALAVALLRTPLTVRGTLAGFGAMVGGVVAGVLLPVGAALALALLIERPHGWFATPGLAWLAFGGLALAGFFAVQWAWERWSGTDAEARSAGALAGATLFWSTVLALLAARGWGSSYLALWWTVPGALALVLWGVLPRWRPLLGVGAWLPGALLTAQAGVLLLKMFVPVAGRFPAPIPFDPVIAALVALPTVALAVTGSPMLHRAGHLGRASAVFASVGTLGVFLLALTFPYTPARPKRLLLRQVAGDTTSTVEVRGMDWVDPAGALAGIGGVPFRPVDGAAGVYARPAELPDLPPLPLQIDSLGTDPSGDGRRVRIRLGRGAYERVSLRLPGERVEEINLPDSLTNEARGEPIHTLRIFPPPTGVPWEITLRIRGREPIRAELTETFAPARTGALGRVLSRLPAWTTTHATAIRERALVF